LIARAFISKIYNVILKQIPRSTTLTVNLKNAITTKDKSKKRKLLGPGYRSTGQRPIIQFRITSAPLYNLTKDASVQAQSQFSVKYSQIQILARENAII